MATLAITTLAVAQVVRVELLGVLAGTGKGKVAWKINDKQGQKQAELQAEGEGLPRNAALSVHVGASAPFAVTTDQFGRYSLSVRYTTSVRPTISAGDEVAVIDAANRTLQAGTMQLK